MCKRRYVRYIHQSWRMSQTVVIPILYITSFKLALLLILFFSYSIRILCSVHDYFFLCAFSHASCVFHRRIKQPRVFFNWSGAPRYVRVESRSRSAAAREKNSRERAPLYILILFDDTNGKRFIILSSADLKLPPPPPRSSDEILNLQFLFTSLGVQKVGSAVYQTESAYAAVYTLFKLRG